MTRKYLLIVSILLELILYYTISNTNKTYIFFRVISHTIIFLWSYQSLKPNLTKTDLLVLLNIFIPIISPILHLFSDKITSVVFELVIISIGNLALIAVFITQKEYFNSKLITKTFLQILVPYIVLPTLFFYFVLHPTTSINEFLVITYILILVVFAVTSSYFSKNQRVSMYLTISVGLLFLASGANGYRLFVTSYFFDFGLVRIATVFSKYFLALGFITNKRLQQ
ncbi:MAG: hypothetical protein MUF45_17420 [Spirosomaceae bacterium]|jgi:hypothetical protein|nr:hypothetical protein [Spirosomataceae bacterium]